MENWTNNGKMELSLRWNNFTENIVSCLETSYGDQDFVDVTLACEGGSVKAHRLILSASSLYFRRILKENPCAHPVVILKGVTLTELQTLLMYMYHGEARTNEQDIPRLLEAARFLEIRGLTSTETDKSSEGNTSLKTKATTSESNSPQLKSILLQSEETPATRKPARPLPRLESISQPELVTTTYQPSVDIEDQNDEHNTEEPEMDLNVKLEIEDQDLSSDSMACEIDFNVTPLHSAANSMLQLPDNSCQDNDSKETESQQSRRKLAFYEPRPCPKCKRTYRDAATLRTHMSIMHEVLAERIACSCGMLFYTKHDMYTHRRKGHKR